MLSREAWSSLLSVSTLVAACLLLVVLCGTGGGAQARKGIAGSIRSDELAEFLSRHDGVILDVRIDGDCDVRLPRKFKVLYIEFNAMSDDVVGRGLEAEEFIARVLRSRRIIAALTLRQTILVLCCEGLRARIATNVLADRGFAALYLEGGLRRSTLTEPLIRTSFSLGHYERNSSDTCRAETDR